MSPGRSTTSFQARSVTTTYACMMKRPLTCSLTGTTHTTSLLKQSESRVEHKTCCSCVYRLARRHEPNFPRLFYVWRGSDFQREYHSEGFIHEADGKRYLVLIPPYVSALCQVFADGPGTTGAGFLVQEIAH